jgi:hypothetical protein
MHVEGICLSLIEEFDQALSGQPYSILPLQRLSESDANVAGSLIAHSQYTLGSATALATNMLTKGSNVPTTTQEVISRTGLGVDTVDDAGNHPLCRPINKAREALNTTTNIGVKVYIIYV